MSPSFPVELSGREMCLASGCLSLFDGWPPLHAAAKSGVDAALRSRAQGVSDLVSEQKLRQFESAGLWGAGCDVWAVEIVERRVSFAGQLELSCEDLDVMSGAFEFVVLEFTDQWGQFLVAAPGNMPAYDMRLSDVVELKGRIDDLRRRLCR